MYQLNGFSFVVTAISANGQSFLRVDRDDEVSFVHFTDAGYASAVFLAEATFVTAERGGDEAAMRWLAGAIFLSPKFLGDWVAPVVSKSDWLIAKLVLAKFAGNGNPIKGVVTGRFKDLYQLWTDAEMRQEHGWSAVEDAVTPAEYRLMFRYIQTV